MEPSQVNPYAIKSMSEIDVDISTNFSQDIHGFKIMEFDYVITVCDNKRERCLVFSGECKRINKGLTDPSSAKDSVDQKLMLLEW